MALIVMISSIPVTVNTDAIKIISHPYIKEIMTEKLKIEVVYVTAPNLVPVM